MAGQNWGRVDNLRYNCCFICVDASLQALDQYVNQRVDHMVEASLVEEACDIHNSDSDYTLGLRQAIGVREFEDFLRYRNSDCQKTSLCPKMHKDNLCEFINSSCEDQSNFTLKEAIDKVKLNTRRLVRRQKRRLNQLQMCFGRKTLMSQVVYHVLWTIHGWLMWLNHLLELFNLSLKTLLVQTMQDKVAKEPLICLREIFGLDTFVRHVGLKEHRGAHEWDQHRQGKGHRKRVSRLRMSLDLPKR